MARNLSLNPTVMWQFRENECAPAVAFAGRVHSARALVVSITALEVVACVGEVARASSTDQQPWLPKSRGS